MTINEAIDFLRTHQRRVGDPYVVPSNGTVPDGHRILVDGQEMTYPQVIALAQAVRSDAP